MDWTFCSLESFWREESKWSKLAKKYQTTFLHLLHGFSITIAGGYTKHDKIGGKASHFKIHECKIRENAPDLFALQFRKILLEIATQCSIYLISLYVIILGDSEFLRFWSIVYKAVWLFILQLTFFAKMKRLDRKEMLHISRNLLK